MVGEADGQIRRADDGIVFTDSPHQHGDLTFGDGRLLCVREAAAGDQLIAISPETAREKILWQAPFLASPGLTAGRLTWTQWADDAMPWDSSEVWTAAYDGRRVHDARRLAGGPDESAVQPRWGPDRYLYFMSDRTGWWNLYRHRGGLTEAVAPVRAECAAAPWELGYTDYVFLPGGRFAMTVQRGPSWSLIVVEPGGRLRPVELPYTSLKPYLAVVGKRVALIGGSPTRAPEVATVAVDGRGEIEVLRRAEPVAEIAAITCPEVMQIRSEGGEVTALFYPPAGHVAGAVPLILRPHAGPTHHSDRRLDGQVQYFTSRGFAVVDVDYRGSTGYGRSFRQALDGQWGIRDVEDCRNVAWHLLAIGRAAPGGVFISGASAGGYTALRAVCEDGPFTLAVARSAIVDPRRWTTTAPRFQRPHAARLANAEAAVRAHLFRAPALLIHGERDEIAPIDDVLALAHGLRQHHRLAGLVSFPEVGHFLSAPAALAAALEAELAAYRAVLDGRRTDA
ncbi:S9 family peptidase [Catellatospora sichuanensis]|uniref:S9 family peptidase n=1 Tax=Catellatospora sichuanensis TaxID=1969805 RepID=UPI001FEA7D0C|nr:prolyl oligopeptidase family serine peptidase [Catellatospora sichuanensis]